MDFFVLPIVAAAASALAFLSGFGLGTVLMPVFAIFFPVEVAVAAAAVVHLANNLFKLALVGKHADRRVLLAFGIPAVLAAFAGAALLARLAPTEPLATYSLAGRLCTISTPKLLIASFLATLAALELSPAYQRLALPKAALPLGGILSGFVGGLTGMQGALRAPFLLKAGLDKHAFVGTTTVLSTAVDLARLAVYAVGLSFLAGPRDHAPLTEPRTLWLLALTCLAGCAGTLASRSLLHGITLRGIRAVVAVLLFVLAAALAAGLI